MNRAAAAAPRKRLDLVALALLVSVGGIWGGQTVIAKIVTVAGVPAFGYAFWQTFGAGLILALVGVVRRNPPPLAPKILLFYAVVGWTGSGIPTANMYVALERIPVGLMALILTTAPLVTYSLALGIRLERLDLGRAAGIGLGFAGGLLILLPKGSLPAAEMLPFVLLAFVTPLFYAISAVYASTRRPAELDPLHTAAGMLLAASALLLPASLGTGTFHPLWRAFGLANGLIVLQIFTTALSFYLYFRLLRRAGPVYFSQVAYLVTVTAVVLGIILFDERHSLFVWGAMALVFIGVALVNWPAGNARAASSSD